MINIMTEIYDTSPFTVPLAFRGAIEKDADGGIVMDLNKVSVAVLDGFAVSYEPIPDGGRPLKVKPSKEYSAEYEQGGGLCLTPLTPRATEIVLEGKMKCVKSLCAESEAKALTILVHSKWDDYYQGDVAWAALATYTEIGWSYCPRGRWSERKRDQWLSEYFDREAANKIRFIYIGYMKLLHRCVMTLRRQAS